MSDAAIDVLVREVSDLRGEIADLRKQTESGPPPPPPLMKADLEGMPPEAIVEALKEGRLDEYLATSKRDQ